jgi:hypothetical protein
MKASMRAWRSCSAASRIDAAMSSHTPLEIAQANSAAASSQC